ncbi:MAG TPA: carbohydrate kinase family protein, partial [Spirochaetia bacterium]|nr:carbohydrate kinase family protein [Spirochaetia bacterium]
MKSPRILVSGLINIETTLRVEGFPLAYNAVNYPFFGVRSTVSGVGYNLAKALTTLGHPVGFLSLVGKDPWGSVVEGELTRDGIPTGAVLADLDQTAQSVILYDPTGRRQIHTDLKDIQERSFPPEIFHREVKGCAVAALCNINFSRALLGPTVDLGIPIATDVHVLTDPRDAYNTDFLAASRIVFLSNEGCTGSEKAMAETLLGLYPRCHVVVVGMGGQGALLACRGEAALPLPAVATRPVVNTIGAGDALFSAFLHGWTRGESPAEA